MHVNSFAEDPCDVTSVAVVDDVLVAVVDIGPIVVDGDVVVVVAAAAEDGGRGGDDSASQYPRHYVEQ